jgi:nicotinate-nucleotide adenylyltransferase
MRIGVFGGTFDPIHVGHLIIAEQCREQAQLDRVLFVPSARPPHKLGQPLTPFDRRAEMIRLAIAGNPVFAVEDLEKDRPGPSYTADTLAELHRRDATAELHLILGADCLPDLPTWHEPARIVAQAKLLVVARPGWPSWDAEQLRSALKLAPDMPVQQQTIAVPLLEIASRDLRQRVADGHSIRYFVSNAVAAYVAEKNLYRA